MIRKIERGELTDVRVSVQGTWNARSTVAAEPYRGAAGDCEARCRVCLCRDRSVENFPVDDGRK